MDERIYRWIDGQTDKRMIGCIDRQIDEWMVRYMTENGWIDKWKRDWMDERISGWMDGWIG